MKKTTLLILLGLALAPATFAGDVTIITAENTPIASTPAETQAHPQAFSITLKPGIMHTNTSTLRTATHDTFDAQTTPSLLYGGTIGLNWDLQQSEGLTHTIGLSAGYFTGKDNYSWDILGDAVDPYALDEYGTYKSEVTAIPVTLSYDLKKDISDSLAIYGGVRAGAMIRKTGIYFDEVANSTTKVRPMAGVGAGIQMYINDNWSLNFSYDFVLTFGKDAKTMEIDGMTVDPSRKHRYYGTIGMGATYSF